MNIDDEYIKMRMFFGCVYTMQKMYGDALHSVVKAQQYLSRKIMAKELIKKRMITNGSDIGTLTKLPNLCLANILSKV